MAIKLPKVFAKTSLHSNCLFTVNSFCITSIIIPNETEISKQNNNLTFFEKLELKIFE